jgi:cell division protein FtsQ
VLPGGGVALVDRIGVVFGSAPAAPPGVPVLDVAAADPHDPVTAAALTVVSELPRELAGQVRTVAAPSPTAVSLTLRGGAVVAWGDTRDAGRKSAALQALLKLRPVSRYDVSTPDVVTTR